MAKKKKPDGQVTIKIRCSTKDRLDKDLAAYIGRSKKVISMAEYIDRLSHLRLKVVGQKANSTD